MTNIDANDAPADAPGSPKLEMHPSRQFPEWLAEHKLSLGFTTYRAGKLFLIGLKDDGHLSVFERSFQRCMGLAAHGSTLVMSSLYQVWRFENVAIQGGAPEGYDALYVPRVGHVTGDLDIHDIAVDASGRTVFVNTLFSCLATVSDTHSFAPLWRPSFVTKLAAEDRCHLNGLAMVDGEPRYVTTIATTDVADGWRDHRVAGGAVIDVQTGKAVLSGLSMPHSPRWHRGKLWLHDSGTGWFGYVDFKRGTFERVTFCRGYLRGLAFAGDFAVMGLSRPRTSPTFEGLPIQDTLAEKRVTPVCGVQVVDLRTGDIVHWLHFVGIVEELYDVVVLPGVRSPTAIGFKTDEIRRILSVAPQ